MSNTIIKKKSNYTQISNTILRDSSISFKAKGLFCYMFSMENNWNFTIKSIATQQKDGEDSIKSALTELKNAGYVEYTKHSDGKGTYLLDDSPKVENPLQGEPKVENPHVENPYKGKSTRIKNTNTNKNTNSKKKNIKKEVQEALEGNQLFENLTDNEKDLYFEYIEMRTSIKIKTTVSVHNRLLKKYYDFGRNTRIIENAINSNWRDFYKLKEFNQNTNAYNNNQPTVETTKTMINEIFNQNQKTDISIIEGEIL